jgi:hypothetical protein
MTKTFIQSRTLTADEKAFVRPACIWLDFGEDDVCNLLPFGTMEIDAVVNGKIGKRKVLAFLRVYEGAEGDYIYLDCLLPHHKVRYWKTIEGNGGVTAEGVQYVTDMHGEPIGGWEAFYA